MSNGYKLDHKLKKLNTQDLLAHTHNYGVDPSSNHIYLFGSEDLPNVEDSEEPGVEYTMSNRFIKNLNLCMRSNPEQPILIHMKTGGGDWAEGMAIYNSIRACPAPVTILAYTYASSMSSLIFLAANKRVLMPDAEYLIHDGSLGVAGTRKQVKAFINHELTYNARTMQIYVDALKEQGKFSSWSRKRIEKMLREQMDKKEDVYLTASEAVRWGFADEVFGDGPNGYDWSKLTEYTPAQLER